MKIVPYERKNEVIVQEVFDSIQGEGRFMGRSATFIRFGECNLKHICGRHCDTPLGNPLAILNSKDDYRNWLVNVLNHSRQQMFVVTGGEPLLYKEQIATLLDLVDDKPINVETNGTIDVNFGDHLFKENLHFSISPKVPYVEEVLNIWQWNLDAVFSFDLKLVVGDFSGVADSPFVDIKDLENVLSMIDDFGFAKEQIYLMPYGKNNIDINIMRNKLWNECVDYGVNYSDRLHILTQQK